MQGTKRTWNQIRWGWKGEISSPVMLFLTPPLVTAMLTKSPGCVGKDNKSGEMSFLEYSEFLHADSDDVFHPRLQKVKRVFSAISLQSYQTLLRLI